MRVTSWNGARPLPTDPQGDEGWVQVMSPFERWDWYLDYSDWITEQGGGVLVPEQCKVVVSAEAALCGFEILSEPFSPGIVWGGTALMMWFGIRADMRRSPIFDGEGVRCAVSATAGWTGRLYRTRYTAAVRVRNL